MLQRITDVEMKTKEEKNKDNALNDNKNILHYISLMVYYYIAKNTFR